MQKIINDNNPDHIHFVDIENELDMFWTTRAEIDKKNLLMRNLGLRLEEEINVPDGYFIKAHKMIVALKNNNEIRYEAIESYEIDFQINKIKWIWIKYN
jgi:hypothetical protein